MPSKASRFSAISKDDSEIISLLKQPGLKQPVAEALADIGLGNYRKTGSNYLETLNLASYRVQLSASQILALTIAKAVAKNIKPETQARNHNSGKMTMIVNTNQQSEKICV